MKILHLTLKKKWFDMIASGEKKEEYREIKKHWIDRLQLVNGMEFPNGECRHFDAIIFRNGYSGDSPIIYVKCEGIEVGYGLMEWGADEGKKYFVIKLGAIISLTKPPDRQDITG